MTMDELILTALEEDYWRDDVTARSALGRSGEAPASARIVSRADGVFSGVRVCEAFARVLAGALFLEDVPPEGEPLQAGDVVLRVRGSRGTILAVERTLLNFLGHACGIATATHEYVLAVGDRPTRILATRKTLPGLRALQLAAVVAGGGHVHRRGLSDGVLIKDNHLLFAPIETAIARAKQARSPLHRIEVEVDTLEQLGRALEARPDVVMLDNFDDADVERAVRLVDGRCAIEVSGGITLERIGTLAALGVDYISVGRLTHSVTALDLSMELDRDEPSC